MPSAHSLLHAKVYVVPKTYALRHPVNIPPTRHDATCVLISKRNSMACNVPTVAPRETLTRSPPAVCKHVDAMALPVDWNTPAHLNALKRPTRPPPTYACAHAFKHIPSTQV